MYLYTTIPSAKTIRQRAASVNLEEPERLAAAFSTCLPAGVCLRASEGSVARFWLDPHKHVLH